MNLKSESSLEKSEADFFKNKDKKSAANLLTQATKSWNNEEINDESYTDKIRIIRDWLQN